MIVCLDEEDEVDELDEELDDMDEDQVSYDDGLDGRIPVHVFFSFSFIAQQLMKI